METATISQYAQKMGIALGMRPEEIPAIEYLAGEEERAMKIRVNKTLVALTLGERKAPAPVFEEKELELFRTITDLKSVKAAKALDEQLEREGQELRNASSHVQNVLYDMAETRTKIRAARGQTVVSLEEDIKAIVADGWFRFEGAKTRSYNAIQSSMENKALIFTTPPVTLRDVNLHAGLDIKVDMGSYKVIYIPGKNVVQVHPHEGNTHAKGFPHPHVSGNFGVCWGNAENIYTQAMRNYSPAAAFAALKTILTSYNVNSPYTPLQNFYYTKHPEHLAGTAVISRLKRIAWVTADLANEHDMAVYDSRENNGEEREEIAVRLFQQVYAYNGLGILVDNLRYFEKATHVDSLLEVPLSPWLWEADELPDTLEEQSED